ncbi:MAG: hypothetical protein ABIO70_19425 [Pseudomonadota bacterium]
MSWFNWLRRDPTTPTAPAAVAESRPDEPPQGEQNPGGELRVDAATLWRDYYDNQVAAEARYQDHPLVVEGEVDHIDRDHRGRIRVHFKIDTYNTLKALYPEAARAEVAELRPGSRVSFAARVASVDTGYVVVEPVVSGA